MTVRKKIIDLLGTGTWTAKEISGTLHISEKEVLYHLEHIQKTIKNRFCIQPATCLSCGFVFSKRRKVKCPGRCPMCKSEHIQNPCYYATAPLNS